jgi:hypothetical protein
VTPAFRTCCRYGDAEDTKHVGGKSQWYDPGKDVVLQIECNTDRQTRVRALSTLNI